MLKGIYRLHDDLGKGFVCSAHLPAAMLHNPSSVSKPALNGLANTLERKFTIARLSLC